MATPLHKPGTKFFCYTEGCANYQRELNPARTKSTGEVKRPNCRKCGHAAVSTITNLPPTRTPKEEPSS